MANNYQIGILVIILVIAFFFLLMTVNQGDISYNGDKNEYAVYEPLVGFTEGLTDSTRRPTRQRRTAAASRRTTPQPTDANVQPTDANAQPTDANVQPTDANAQPMETTPRPMETTPRPMETTPRPTDANTQPMFTTTPRVVPTEPAAPTQPIKTPGLTTMQPIKNNSSFLNSVIDALSKSPDPATDKVAIYKIQGTVSSLKTQNAATLLGEIGNPNNLTDPRLFLHYMNWFGSNCPIDSDTCSGLSR